MEKRPIRPPEGDIDGEIARKTAAARNFYKYFCGIK
jgi:hypothetical protein